jgi:site-specific DNA recombinase
MKRTSSSSTRLRAALYARVISEEQVQGYSLGAQDREGKRYCETHNWDLVAVYRDEGKSARTDDLAKRPDFARMLTDAEAGMFDIIIARKLDRFARNLRVTLEMLERLNRCGVGFVSISENMDFASPIGKVNLATLAAFAQYYSDNLSFETKNGEAERKAQGLYNGLLPFGIKPNTKRNADGVPVADPQSAPAPDPETYSGLLLAFRLAAEGKSDREVADALNAAGCRTTGNRGKNPFTKDGVRRILMNRFYLGELPDGNGGWIEGAHEAVLDEELFMRALDARQANARPAANVRRSHRRYSFSGLAVCGGCGGPLHFHTAPNGKARAYCYRVRQRSGCGQRAVYLDGLSVASLKSCDRFSRTPRPASRRARGPGRSVGRGRPDSTPRGTPAPPPACSPGRGRPGCGRPPPAATPRPAPGRCRSDRRGAGSIDGRGDGSPTRSAAPWRGGCRRCP